MTKKIVPTADPIKAIAENDQLSKSEKIRQLFALGTLTQYKIAKLLGIIPQFVNNVITKDRNKVAK